MNLGDELRPGDVVGGDLRRSAVFLLLILASPIDGVVSVGIGIAGAANVELYFGDKRPKTLRVGDRIVS